MADPSSTLARFGALTLELLEQRAGAGSQVTAPHPEPHFGFVRAGAFAVLGGHGREHWVRAGQLRAAVHRETLRLAFPSEGLSVLVGTLAGVSALCTGPLLEPPPEVRAALTASAALPGPRQMLMLEGWFRSAHARVHDPRPVPAWLPAFVAELAPLARERHSARRLAHLLGRHRASVHRAFRRGFGMDPSAWLLRRRVELALERLEGEAALADIATEAGFADQSHMTRVFSALTGRTPGRWRQTLGGTSGVRPAFKT